MKENLALVQGWIGLSEGGFVDHPNDPGGPTDRGITQRTFDAWNRRLGRPKTTVRGISRVEAERIIEAQYLVPVRFDDLPAGLDYAVADWSVNSGPSRAARELQNLLGVAVDGQIGEVTLAAIAAVGSKEDLITRYCMARMRFLRQLKTWPTFGRGWTARVMGQIDGVQDEDIGVIDRAVRLARGAEVIPPPRSATPGKAQDQDISARWLLTKALADPAALIPGVGAIMTPMFTGMGPVQWALAGMILIGGGYLLIRTLRRGRLA